MEIQQLIDDFQKSITQYQDACAHRAAAVRAFDGHVSAIERRIADAKAAGKKRMAELEKLLNGSASDSLKDKWNEELEGLAVTQYEVTPNERIVYWDLGSNMCIAEVRGARDALWQSVACLIDFIKKQQDEAIKSSFFSESYMLQQDERIRQRYNKLG